MELACDPSIAPEYVSGAQRARVISESWFAGNCYCLACEEESLARLKPNTKPQTSFATPVAIVTNSRHF